MSIQHQLGQHYSKEEELVENYIDRLKKIENKVLIDPFVGEGHLLFFYLNLFNEKKQKFIINNKLIMGFDLYEKNIKNIKEKFKEKYNTDEDILDDIFKIKDSLLDSDLPKNTFIFTNPPYLAKNICKKNYPDDFERYFKTNFKEQNDYFEIALNNYSGYDGIWIVPANLFSSDIMNNIRKKIIFNLEDIFIYQKKIFEDTDITVTTFMINNKKETKIKDITFINDKKEKIEFNISDKGNLSNEWDNIKKIKNTNNIRHGYIDNNIIIGNEKVCLLNTKYKEEFFFITKEDKEKLENNCLILRTTDTGTEKGKIGLYTIEELWGSKNAIGLVTKKSSRVYTQIFFNNLTINEQLKLKKEFNIELNSLRKKYKSIFLTNYKNSSNGEQRKRISFKESFSLLNKLIDKQL